MRQGMTFEEFQPGDVMRTARRTVTETDVVQFVNLSGLVEPLFLDAEYMRDETDYGGRIAPGSLHTFALGGGTDHTRPG